MRIRKDILEADKIFNEASKNLTFSSINPTNINAAKRKFLNNSIKNPVLKYEIPNVNLLELRRKVSSVNLDEKSILDTFMIEKQEDIIRKIDLINSVGCFDFTERSIKLYGLPNKILVDKAHEILNQKYVKEPEKKILSKDVVFALKKNLKEFNLNYKIIKEDIVSSCNLEASQKKISLKKKSRFSELFINRLIVHEIGTHAFRYENGKQHKLSIFANGFANYLETEEGLAAYNEERFNLLGQSFLRNYAGRVLAVNYAQEFGFYKTFKKLNKFFDKKKAFQLSLRAKRGLSDTELAGGFTKDVVYLRGYYRVKNYIGKGGKLKDLYYGKIGIEDVELIKKLRLERPKIIPDKFLLFGQDKTIDEVRSQ
ncbi:DUF1704 domain-containing protein [Candidatus Woesearchaeota archaeon]|nr:DUF1704 domain-containing protein [Candidatus Woesearchaeota archaeon]